MNATTTTEALILAGDGYHLKVSPEAYEKKAELLSKASTVTQVTSIEESGNAQFHLRRCAEMRILIEKSRKAVKEPVLIVGKAIDKAAADFLADIEGEEIRIRGLVGAHAEEVERLKAIKAEEERRAFEEARATRLAKEQAEQAAAETRTIADVLAAKQAAEKKLEDLKASDVVDPKAVKKAEDALKNLTDEKKSRDAVITANLNATLKTAGYPTKADPMKVNKLMVILILTYLVLLVTMVYGPIAAMLVEMFPTRIRYTSMSLPYHIGNGWFGGLLPTTAFAIVAQTGNMYNGLWYPIIIAGATFIIGTLFIKETKDVDIYADD